MANWRQPSRIRRLGREAFYPGDNPNDRNPFKNEQSHIWFADVLARDWEEGWFEGQDRYLNMKRSDNV